MDSGYQEARETAAFDERRDRGRVRLTGADSKSFLHALVTNDIDSLAPGTGCYAALLTPQGRMITDMHVVVSAADAVYVIVPSDAAAPLAARLDTSIFTEAVAVEDVSASTGHFSVTGPAARDVVDRSIHTVGAGAEATAWRSDDLGIEGLDIIVPLALSAALGAQLQTRAARLSSEARDVLRVEAGRPEFHVDMTEETIPLEANLLDRAISTTKGCYVGQEVIIRVLHRGGGRVAKRLVQLRFDGGEQDVPAQGTPMSVNGKDVGRVTSAVWSPRARAAIGLGYVHRDFIREGLTMSIPGGREATITAA